MATIDTLLVNLFNDYAPILKESLVRLRQVKEKKDAELDTVINVLSRKVSLDNIVNFNKAILLGEAILVEANIELPRPEQLKKAIKEDLKNLSDEIIGLYVRYLEFKPLLNDLHLKIANEYKSLNQESAEFVINQIMKSVSLDANHKKILLEKIIRVL